MPRCAGWSSTIWWPPCSTSPATRRGRSRARSFPSPATSESHGRHAGRHRDRRRMLWHFLRRPAGEGEGQGKGRLPPRDRKSTRLNSSHSQISYAVFCLKKKKKRSDNTGQEIMQHEKRLAKLAHF